jgi:hypothetical protein
MGLIQDEIRKMVGDGSARHKRLIEYAVRQLGTGRDLADVLDDPYITNRSNAIDRRALLEEPEVVEAAGAEVLEQMRERLEAIAEQQLGG